MLKSVIAIAALAAAGSANATVLFSDNFDGQTTGLNSSLAGWTVAGQVDVVDNGTYSIECSGKCVDLDGTPGPGGITSNLTAFSAGKKVTISFDISGNQRNSSADNFLFEFLFANMTDINGLTTLTGYPGAPVLLGDFANVERIYTEYDVAGDQPFVTYSLSFTPVQGGEFQIRFSTTSGDNIGPVLDNVLVSQVPEPATWAMLITGFGLVGAGLRRRRAVAA